MVRARFVLLLALPAAACAPSARYPSLAPRPVESVSLAEPGRAAPPPGTAAPAADARFAAPLGQARDGDAAFRRALAQAEPVLRRGLAAPVGGDAWLAAQSALSRVEAARGPVTQALLTLQAASEQPAVRSDTGLAQAAARALEAVSAIDADESRALAAAAPRRS